MNLKTTTSKTMTRRRFVGGALGVSTVAATGALFGGAVARAATGIAPAGRIVNSGPIDLAKYHCSLVHKAMSDKLTRMVADPEVSSTETAHALKTTFCPCCNTQINASFPVVPWSEIGKAYG